MDALCSDIYAAAGASLDRPPSVAALCLSLLHTLPTRYSFRRAEYTLRHVRGRAWRVQVSDLLSPPHARYAAAKALAQWWRMGFDAADRSRLACAILCPRPAMLVSGSLVTLRGDSRHWRGFGHARRVLFSDDDRIGLIAS